jgi:hypothetical protein
MQKELFDRQQKILFDYDATIALYRDTITVPGADRALVILARTSRPSVAKCFPMSFSSS